MKAPNSGEDANGARTLTGGSAGDAGDAGGAALEARWYREVYRGDGVPQLTVRAAIMGALLGALMATSNLYTVLKLGWSFGVVVTASVLSFALWNGVRRLSGGRVAPMGLLESNCMASCASAAGYSTGSTVGVAFAALLLLQGQHQPGTVVAAYVCFSAGLGVFLAIPLKRQLVNRERLPFPTGTAAAETLKALHTAGAEAVGKATGLVVALVGALGLGLLRSYGTLVDALAGAGYRVEFLQRLQKTVFVPEAIPLAGLLNPLTRGQLAGLSFEPSALLLGSGMMMGPRVAFSMLAGSLLLYYGVAPWMAAYDAANASVPGHVPSFTYRPDGSFNPVRWSLWGGTSLMLFASLTVLALEWRTLTRAFKGFGERARSGAGEIVGRAEAIEVPVHWVAYGLIPFGAGMVWVLNWGFGVSVPLGVLSVLLSVIVTLVCCRATGETDTTPVGPMGKLTQLVYGMLPGSAGNTAVNLMTAGATTSAGMAAADLLTDLKSGYLLGAHPRRQFFAQFIGVFVGTLAVVPAWYLMVPTRERLEAMSPPAANMWKAVADLLTKGFAALPPSAGWIVAIGAVVGVILPLAERLVPKARPYLPSAMGLGFSWAFAFQNSLSFALGAGLAWAWSRIARRGAETYSVPVASGLIAGESLVAAAVAIACTVVGLRAASGGN